MGSSPSPPAAPDPYKTAGIQENENVDTAVANSLLNNVNQVTPYGSINYAQTGSQQVDNATGGPPINIPTFTATTALSPDLQALSTSDIANAQQAANTQGMLGRNVASTLATPLNLGPSATSAYLDKIASAELEPQLAQQKAQLDQTLADQGLTPGSPGWNYQQQQFGLNSAQARNDLYLQGQNTAMSALEAQYNEPLNALSALQSQSQVSEPGVGTLAPTTQSPIQPSNFAQDQYNSYQGQLSAYQSQLQQSNAITGGLFGLGGDIIKGGFGLFGSDREDKTDIQKLGKDPDTGLPAYAYRYKGDAKNTPKVIGVMAQDVEKVMPSAVHSIGGHKVIAVAPGVRFGIGS